MSRIVRGGLIQCANPINDESQPVSKIQAAALEAHMPFIQQAADKGVEMLCLQEIFNGPYFCPSQAIRWYDAAESVPGPSTELFQGIAKKHGMVIVVPVYRAIAWDRLREQAPLADPVTFEEIKGSFRRIASQDYGMTEMRWSSRFLSERRQASEYRKGRVFLAGDAAHIHSPLGGQGMNTGIGDAMNLGWKLAAATRSTAPFWLLDSYSGERIPLGESVLRLTDAFNELVLGRSMLQRIAQRVAVGALTRIPPTRRFMAGRLSGIGIAYPHAAHEHRMVGERMPDFGCGGTRVYELLRAQKFVLVTAAAVDLDRPGIVRAVGTHPGLPEAVLVRPDGYVAWASDRIPQMSELVAAVEHWLGA